MAKYTAKRENGVYRIYKDDAPMKIEAGTQKEVGWHLKRLRKLAKARAANAGLTETLDIDYLQNVTLKYDSNAQGWNVFKMGKNMGFVYLLESNEYGAETHKGIGWDGIDTLEDAVIALLTN